MKNITLALAEEPLARRLVALELGRQELQRDRLPQLQVVGAVHLAHAAAAHARDDAIAAGQERAGDERARACLAVASPKPWRRRAGEIGGGGEVVSGMGDAAVARAVSR